jgi:nucleoid DNA-binding protein
MKKTELARELARTTGVTRAEAADQVDRVVNAILERLRDGKTAQWPGFGQFNLDSHGNIQFRQEPKVEKP